MRIAYLMTVHRNPLLLKRVIATLSNGRGAGFFIHVDRKADFGPFSGIDGEGVSFSQERIPVYWCEFSQVEATLLLIRQALAYPGNYDYFVFLQGSDYPIRSGAYIQQFFEANRDQEFISIAKVPAPGYPLSKINRVWYPPRKPVSHFVANTLARLGLADRDYKRYLGGLDAYAGEAFWALSRGACEHIVQFETANPQLATYFRSTCTSDEMFFHTILGNSSFRARVRRNLVYFPSTMSIRDEDRRHLVNKQHIEFFERQAKVIVSDQWGTGETLFARKFSDERLDLVDRIDEIIKQQPLSSPS